MSPRDVGSYRCNSKKRRRSNDEDTRELCTWKGQFLTVRNTSTLVYYLWFRKSQILVTLLAVTKLRLEQ